LPVELRPAAAAHRRFTEALHDMLDPAWGRYAPEYARQQCVRDTRPFRVSRHACRSAPSFLAELEQVLRRRHYQEETVRKYTGCVRRFLAWADSAPAAVTRAHVGRFLMHLKDQGRSAATLSLHLSALRTAFDRILNERVTAGYYLARPTRPRRTGLQPTQCEALLRAASCKRDALILFCLLVLKLKPAEICHLRVADVDAGHGVLRTWRGYGRAEKNKPVPAALLALLTGFAAGRDAAEPLFPATPAAERALGVRGIQQMLARTARRAGVRSPVNCRSLRRSNLPEEHVGFTAPAHDESGHKGRENQHSPAPVLPPPFAIPARLRVAHQKTHRRKGWVRSSYRLVVSTPGRPPVELGGVVVVQFPSGDREVRFPPRADWQKALCWLPRTVSARIGTVAWRRMTARAVERYHRRLAPGHAPRPGRRRRFL